MKFVFESILMMLLLAAAVFFIGIPIIQLVKMMLPKRKDPVAEANARLEAARKEAEAARLNKETEKVYSSLYEDVLQDDEGEKRKL